MGIVVGIIAGLAAIFGSVLSRIIAEEVRDWLPFVSKKLLLCAIKRMPEDQRQRYHEEWAADLNMFPGRIAQAIRAGGFYAAALKTYGAVPAKYKNIRRIAIKPFMIELFKRIKFVFAVPELKQTFLAYLAFQCCVSAIVLWGILHFHWHFGASLVVDAVNLGLSFFLGRWLRSIAWNRIVVKREKAAS
jgi:hypothetical protein